MGVAQPCPTLGDPMDCSRQVPVSMGIPPARILEWVAMPSSRGSSQPRDRSQGLTLQVYFLPSEPPQKPMSTGVGSLSFLQGIFLT